MNDSNKPKRIQLTGNGRHEEAIAAGTITPGFLIALTSAGKVIANAVAGAVCESLFALEDALQGRDISTNYVADELVSYCIPQPGDTVYAWLSAGENVAIGDKLTSAGNGRLKAKGGSDIAKAVALEAVDLSDTGSEPARIKVRVL